jgi:hypothetical protein
MTAQNKSALNSHLNKGGYRRGLEQRHTFLQQITLQTNASISSRSKSSFQKLRQAAPKVNLLFDLLSEESSSGSSSGSESGDSANTFLSYHFRQ